MVMGLVRELVADHESEKEGGILKLKERTPCWNINLAKEAQNLLLSSVSSW
jgi:hypothetical protein